MHRISYKLLLPRTLQSTYPLKWKPSRSRWRTDNQRSGWDTFNTVPGYSGRHSI